METISFKENEPTIADLKKKYANEIIQFVWERLAGQGITNAGSLIGTRSTIENVDSEKFWNEVKKEDIENSILSSKGNIKKQLEIFDKYGDIFVPELGVFSNNDTSFFENKIKELEVIKGSLK